MFWIALGFVALVAVTAIVYVVTPLFQPSRTLRAEEDDKLADLVYRKDETMRSIKEVEFDYHTGKLSQADYEQYDQRLRQQAIALIRQIEVRAPEMTEMDASLEKAIATRRKVTDPAAEAVDANGRAPATAPGKANFCHNCGTQARPDDRFCANCGTALRTE